jgi:hypothetical protein
MCELLNKFNNKNVNIIKKNIKKNKNDNPKLIIKQFTLPDKRHFNVCQDGELIAGTKQRVAVKFVKYMIHLNPKIEYLVYAGISNGFGPVATAYAAYKLKLKSIVFLAKKSNMTKNEIISSRQVSTIHALGGQIYLCDDYRSARNKEYEFASIINNDNTWKDKENYLVIPMGLNDDKDIMINLLSKQIKKAIKNTIITKLNNIRIWLVMGTGGIFEAIYNVFPDATYFVYLTGSGRYLEYTKKIIKNKNVTILNTIKLTKKNNLDRKIFYDSVMDYDDIIWDYLVEYGQDSDFIWNVASDNIY